MSNNTMRVAFGAGCFWCTEAVFQRLKGVHSVKPGYAGGRVANPTYREVCSGLTGHNEVILVEYDPASISFEQLLEVFFSSHDPTTLNRQGNDVGTQYRSGIYYTSEDQRLVAESFMAGKASELWRDPIVTELEALGAFYPAEEYHMNYYNENSSQAYCQVIINPKLNKLRANFSELLKDEKA